MSTIINIANELQALQGRITADKAALLEARAVMEAEYNSDCAAAKSVLDAALVEIHKRYDDWASTSANRHARLMAFIDGQIAAKDEAIEGDTQTMRVNEYQQAAE